MKLNRVFVLLFLIQCGIAFSYRTYDKPGDAKFSADTKYNALNNDISSESLQNAEIRELKKLKNPEQVQQTESLAEKISKSFSETFNEFKQTLLAQVKSLLLDNQSERKETDSKTKMLRTNSVGKDHKDAKLKPNDEKEHGNNEKFIVPKADSKEGESNIEEVKKEELEAKSDSISTKASTQSKEKESEKNEKFVEENENPEKRAEENPKKEKGSKVNSIDENLKKENDHDQNPTPSEVTDKTNEIKNGSTEPPTIEAKKETEKDLEQKKSEEINTSNLPEPNHEDTEKTNNTPNEVPKESIENVKETPKEEKVQSPPSIEVEAKENISSVKSVNTSERTLEKEEITSSSIISNQAEIKPESEKKEDSANATQTHKLRDNSLNKEEINKDPESEVIQPKNTNDTEVNNSEQQSKKVVDANVKEIQKAEEVTSTKSPTENTEQNKIPINNSEESTVQSRKVNKEDLSATDKSNEAKHNEVKNKSKTTGETKVDSNVNEETQKSKSEEPKKVNLNEPDSSVTNHDPHEPYENIPQLKEASKEDKKEVDVVKDTAPVQLQSKAAEDKSPNPTPEIIPEEKIKLDAELCINPEIEVNKLCKEGKVYEPNFKCREGTAFSKCNGSCMKICKSKETESSGYTQQRFMEYDYDYSNLYPVKIIS